VHGGRREHLGVIPPEHSRRPLLPGVLFLIVVLFSYLFRALVCSLVNLPGALRLNDQNCHGTGTLRVLRGEKKPGS
jgi:hypothetical protein